jgi:hypothetical protein
MDIGSIELYLSNMLPCNTIFVVDVTSRIGYYHFCTISMGWALSYRVLFVCLFCFGISYVAQAGLELTVLQP